MKLIECPRDAMQGLPHFVPTDLKVDYLNALLRVGFDVLDAGSFVSPKAIPQMADTEQVFERLDLSDTRTSLLAIVANEQGAEQALRFSAVKYLGFPLSLSETFQQRNTRRSIAQAWETVWALRDLCVKHGRTLVVYLSMGFGNPYGDSYHPGMLVDFAEKLSEAGIRIVSVADTLGSATPQQVGECYGMLRRAMPTIEFGLHLHTAPVQARAKVLAAWHAGCRRLDTALGGMGGCPMADDELVGNLPTEVVVEVFAEIGVPLPLDLQALQQARAFLPRLH